MSAYRLVSRASPLARVQVQEALDLLAEHTTLPTIEVEYLATFGDKDHSISLLDPNVPTDLFTRDLDELIRQGKADFSVHSAKDLPDPLPSDMEIYALLPAHDQTDCMVCRSGFQLDSTLAGLPTGARVGTSSSVRKSELERLRPDLTVVPIRGTISERIALVDEGKIDALIAATCALIRLGLEKRITTRLDFQTHPMQGILAVTGLAGRNDLAQLFSPIDTRKANLPKIWYTGTHFDHLRRNARVTHFPLIEISPLSDYFDIDPVLRNMSHFDWLIFTSRYTVRHFVERTLQLEVSRVQWRNVRVAAVGKATAEELTVYGIAADLIAQRESSEGLVEEFLSFKPGLKIFLPCSDQALSVLENGLKAQGHWVTKKAMYRNRPSEKPNRWNANDFDEIVLTSPSTVKELKRRFPEISDRVLLTPIGEQTRKTLNELYPGRTLGNSILNT